MIILDALFFFIVILIVFVLFGYEKVITWLVRGKRLSKRYRTPKITVIIPAHNEEANIEKKVKNIIECYPKNKMDILVVDNGSTDRTAEIARKLPVKLLKSKPGKINALNIGLEVAKTEIIVITDADAILDTDCIKEAVACLHGNIVAVGGSTVMKEKNLFYMKGKLEYSKKDWGLRYKEGLLDSTASLDGKFIAFRKTLYSRFPEKCYSDDYDMTLRLRMRGYRCVIAKDALVYEESPAGFKEEVKQVRNRMGLVLMINFKRLRLLFNPKYGYFGMLIFPCRRFFPLIFPLFAGYITFYMLYRSLFYGSLFLLSFFILLRVLKKEYLLMQLIGVSLAWLDVICFRVGSEGRWKKVKN